MKGRISWKPDSFLDGFLEMAQLGLSSLGSLGVLELLQSLFWCGRWVPASCQAAGSPMSPQDSQIFSARQGAGKHHQDIAWGLLVSCCWAGGDKSWSKCELILSGVVLFHVNVTLNNAKTVMVSIHHLCNLCFRQFSWGVICQQWCVLPCHIPRVWTVQVSLNGGRGRGKCNDFLATGAETAIMHARRSADEIATSVLSYLQIPLISF